VNPRRRNRAVASVLALSVAVVVLAQVPVAHGATKRRVPTTKSSKSVAPAKGQPGVEGIVIVPTNNGSKTEIATPAKPLAYVCKGSRMLFNVFGFTPGEEVEFTADGTRLPDAVSNARGFISRSAFGVNSVSTVTICSTGAAGVTMRFVTTGKTSKKSLTFTVAGVEPVKVAGFDRTAAAQGDETPGSEIPIPGPPFICVPKPGSTTRLIIRTTGLDILGGKTEIAANGQHLGKLSGGSMEAECRDLTGLAEVSPEDVPGDETYRITDYWTGRYVQFVVSQIQRGRKICQFGCDIKPVFPTA
jgi:hypothetical protein